MSDTDANNGKDGFTLDKIEISPQKKQSEDVEDTPLKEKKGDETSIDSSMLKNILAFVLKHKLLIGLFLASLMFVLSVILVINSSQQKAAPTQVKQMTYNYYGALGDKYRIKFKVVIPFEDQKEKAELNIKLHKLKNELIIKGSHQSIEKMVQKNEYQALKKELYKIIHSLTAVPVQKMNITTLSLEKT